MSLLNSEFSYNSKTYGGRVAYFKTRGVQGRVSLFDSGKMISIGTNNIERAFSELKLALKFLVNRKFIKNINIHPKIRNIVILADFGRTISIEELSEKANTIYEPEQFPGLILRVIEPHKATVLVFSSGKVVIAGLKEVAQISAVVQVLEGMLE